MDHERIENPFTELNLKLQYPPPFISGQLRELFMKKVVKVYLSFFGSIELG